MRSSLPMAARLCFVLLLLQLFSCSKIDLNDLLHHPDKVPQLCDIQKITNYQDFGDYHDTIIATFSYNRNGDPVSILFNRTNTGRPHLFFKYDKQGRLTDYYGPYSEGPNAGFEFWYRYQYDARGKRITGDTLYGFGDLRNGVPIPGPTYIRVEKFTYDQYDRVIRIERNWVNIPGIPVEIVNYAYDSRGNRTDRTYGDKPSLHRTNKVWMLVDHEYSVNNWLPALRYNQYGLPLQTDPSGFASFLYQISLNKAVFEYRCQ